MVMGDIHGAHLALKQVLERSKFDFDNDTLIQLGDVADGWPYVYECVETLLSIRYGIYLRGNHDDWFKEWIETGIHPDGWRQGGMQTKHSYQQALMSPNRESLTWSKMGYGLFMPPVHKDFWLNQLPYYVDKQNRLFIHAGFHRELYLKDQLEYNFWWDRELWKNAKNLDGAVDKLSTQEDFKVIFIGHTQLGAPYLPIKACNIWNLDTGAGWNGKLTIMDISTYEYWQSDNVQDLYPNEKRLDLY